ncbi:MAG TPA: DUF4058 family protein [Tepidisphaeraceae bacterium]|jgi:hypothetical protein|nr:DUF4058 family protein [Tepidisphaeraceae bacterium]
MPKNSPFPGMDPYLEAHWGDIHHSIIQYARDQLQERLPDALRARVEERVFVESDDGWNRNIFPDVRIIERSGHNAAMEIPSATDSGGVAVAEPLFILLPHESLTEGFIEIRDASSGNQIVTVIEVLSAANKAGANGTLEYKRKQQEILSGRTNLVEIDLLRGGKRVTSVPLATIPPSHRTAYHICVKRGWRGDEFEIYRAPFRQRLPIIPIPLRRTDPDATLDLQALVDQAYRTGRYDDTDYRVDPDPPLDGDDARWADELLRRESRR